MDRTVTSFPKEVVNDSYTTEKRTEVTDDILNSASASVENNLSDEENRKIGGNVGFGKIYVRSDLSDVSLHEVKGNLPLLMGNGFYACETCGVAFKTELRLANHVRAHGLRKFGCFICNRFFSNQKNLKIHLSSKLHTPAARKNYHCGHCQKRFSLKFSFQRHKLKHLISGCTIKCDRPDCFKRFTRVSDLVLHQKTHRKDHVCDKCQRSFARKYFFENHRCPLRFICECKLSFPSRQKLELHAKMHSADASVDKNLVLSGLQNQDKQKARATVCDVCYRRFRNIADLRNHKTMTHSVAAFTCSMCDAQFNRKMDLNMHQKSHKKEYPCCECDKIFQHSFSLKRHSLEKHRASVSRNKCLECEKSFSNLQDLVLHSKSHKVLHAVDDSPGLLGYLLT